MKKFSGPGYALGSINRLEELAWAERRRNPTPVEACDGCFRRFHSAPPEEREPWDDEEEEEEEEKRDAGDPFRRCTECDYTICEDCTHPEMQGAFHSRRFPPSLFIIIITISFAELCERQAHRTLIGHVVLAVVPSPTLA